MNSTPTSQGGSTDVTPAPITLPEEIAVALRSAYQEYSEAARKRSSEGKSRREAARDLARLGADGREAGWSLIAMAKPCDVTPERLRQIIQDYNDGEPSGITFPTYEPPKRQPTRVARVRAHLSDEERAKIAELAKDAIRCSGSTKVLENMPEDEADPEEYRRKAAPREASKEFSALLMEHHDRGVTWAELAEATNGTHGINGVRMRAARHGYGAGSPPSMAPFRDVDIHARVRPKDVVVGKPGKGKSAKRTAKSA